LRAPKHWPSDARQVISCGGAAASEVVEAASVVVSAELKVVTAVVVIVSAAEVTDDSMIVVLVGSDVEVSLGTAVGVVSRSEVERVVSEKTTEELWGLQGPATATAAAIESIKKRVATMVKTSEFKQLNERLKKTRNE